MDCPSCAGKISAALEKLAGVEEAAVNFSTGQLLVSYHPQQVSESSIRERLITMGYRLPDTSHQLSANPDSGEPTTQTHRLPHHHAPHHLHHPGSHSHGTSSIWTRELPIVLLVSTLLLIGIRFEQTLRNTPFSIGEWVVFLPAYLLSGWTVLKTAGRNLLRGQWLDENFLMTVATLGAIAIQL